MTKQRIQLNIKVHQGWKIINYSDDRIFFDKKTEKLGLISKVYYKNLTPSERTTVHNKKLE